MKSNPKIKNALISVSDKSNLRRLISSLVKRKINIISSGGTFKEIIRMGFKCQEISGYTNFKEMLDGRVKTLHPKVHAGILNDRLNNKHQKEMRKRKFQNIDLIIVNFYPFQKTIKNTKSFKKIIENIDIGGPTMVRAGAKNFKYVTVVTSEKDYDELINEINENQGGTSFKFREKMASKAFSLTAYYDSVISNWLNNKLDLKFPDTKTIYGKKVSELRYGENPHQRASIYSQDGNLNLKKIKGKNLSYNNYNDIFTGLEILSSFNKKKVTVIIKHANPSGVSTNDTAIKSFENAFKSDPVSAFGGVVVCNYRINKKIAKKMVSIFFEVILAKGIDQDAMKIFNKKKNLIIIDISNYKFKTKDNNRFFGSSFLSQSRNDKIFDNSKLKFVSKLKPTKKEMLNVRFAMNVCKFVKSNAIVISNNFSTIGIGAGQPSRVDSCKIAVEKASRFQIKKLKNSVAASDAFFPFSDGVKKLINCGVKTIVQPGGSIRDKESIKLANKFKVKMIFTGIRHFNH